MKTTVLTTATIAVALSGLLGGCATSRTEEAACTLPQGHNLQQAIGKTRFDLETGCEHRFEDYFRQLLTIAQGDPKKENKTAFSDFLVWANNQDIISKQQAREYYNRYFGMKFISLQSDYSVCSDTCPKKTAVLRDMRNELQDKELGLIKVSADKRSFHRASQLYEESELVLEAACTACGPLE